MYRLRRYCDERIRSRASRDAYIRTILVLPLNLGVGESIYPLDKSSHEWPILTFQSFYLETSKVIPITLPTFCRRL